MRRLYSLTFLSLDGVMEAPDRWHFDAIRELKQQPGADLHITGSATLVRSLLEAGLLDELRIQS